MRKKLLSIFILTFLVASTLVGCSGDPTSTSSTLTIFSITEGTVLVMKAGADDWTQATPEMPLDVGDTIKTGDNSSAEITFFDGSTIELEAGTQIEITSLDTSPDTGTKTITLMQTIGTTISRVTKLLDPASSYAVETPSGVAAVRGSTLIVRIVFDDPNYEDGTVLMTCMEGDIWAVWNGVEVQILEGYTCVIGPDGLLELVPPNEPPQEETSDVTDEGTAGGEDVTDEGASNGESEELQPGGSTIVLTPEELADLRDILNSITSGGNGQNGGGGNDQTGGGGNDQTGGGTTATIEIKITSNPNGGAVYIWDATAGDWFTEGTEATDPGGVSFELAGDHHYYIWVAGEDTTYDPKTYPEDWTEESAPEGDAQAVYGLGEDAKETGNNPFHFSGNETQGQGQGN
jgi:hypothetical protein